MRTFLGVNLQGECKRLWVAAYRRVKSVGIMHQPFHGCIPFGCSIVWGYDAFTQPNLPYAAHLAYPPTLLPPQTFRIDSTPLYGDVRHMHKIGDLFTHITLDGLFIIVYKSDKRYGLRALTTGKTRYITTEPRVFRSQYTPLEESCK